MFEPDPVSGEEVDQITHGHLYIDIADVFYALLFTI